MLTDPGDAQRYKAEYQIHAATEFGRLKFPVVYSNISMSCWENDIGVKVT